jgi:hypothetical protein
MHVGCLHCHLTTIKIISNINKRFINLLSDDVYTEAVLHVNVVVTLPLVPISMGGAPFSKRNSVGVPFSLDTNFINYDS